MTVLPRIGLPATRALEQAGIMTLEQVAEHSAAELLALHGVGAKAVQILAAELNARGLKLRGDGK